MGYVPQGRTDEASHDYTDNPALLALKFSRSQLEDALSEAGPMVACQLKFDYEEWVPVEAVREALEHCDQGMRARWY